MKTFSVKHLIDTLHRAVRESPEVAALSVAPVTVTNGPHSASGLVIILIPDALQKLLMATTGTKES